MRRYRLQESELLAMQWLPETHDEVAEWLTDHGFGFHVHDFLGDEYCGNPSRPMGSMCIDTGDDLEIELGWWLTWDEATGELSYDMHGFSDAWRLAE